MVSDAGSDLVASETQGEVRVRKYFQGILSCVAVRDKTSEDRERRELGRPIDHNLPGASTIVFARIQNIDSWTTAASYQVSVMAFEAT